MAQDDNLLTPFWKHWFATPAQRCLIPFTAFAEAEGPKGKMTRTWISVEDQPTAAWAGLCRPSDERSEARRVGKEGVRTLRSRWSPKNLKKKITNIIYR